MNGKQSIYHMDIDDLHKFQEELSQFKTLAKDAKDYRDFQNETEITELSDRINKQVKANPETVIRPIPLNSSLKQRLLR